MLHYYIFAVTHEPTSLNAASKINSTHVNITVTWESPLRSYLTPLMGYVIYYQPKRGTVRNVTVFGGFTEMYLLEGLQRGVTYNISILALSHELPSPLVGPITVIPGISGTAIYHFTYIEPFTTIIYYKVNKQSLRACRGEPGNVMVYISDSIRKKLDIAICCYYCVMLLTEPILTVEVSPSSVTISPNDQFTVTCTARAEVDGQGLLVEVLRWVRITTSPSGSVNYSRLNCTECDITVTGSPESGYQSILTTTENDTVNMIIYRCRARISDTKNFSDVIVTIPG